MNLFQKTLIYGTHQTLIITPHISSDSQGNYIEMVLKIFFKNLKLFIENKELINQIDKNLGY
jgi:phosphoglycerate dehydrogenase-like enzyme